MRSTRAGILLASLTAIALLSGCAGDTGPGSTPPPSSTPPSDTPEPSTPAASGTIGIETGRLVLADAGGSEQAFGFDVPTDGAAATAALTELFGAPVTEDLGVQYSGDTLVRDSWDGFAILTSTYETSVHWEVRSDVAEVDGFAVSTIGGITVGDTRADVLAGATDAVEWGIPQLLIGGGGDETGQVDQVELGLESDTVVWITAPSCSCDV